MLKVISPAVWLAGRFRVGHKLLGAGVLVLVPLLVLSGLQVADHWREVRQQKTQRAALALQVPAQALAAAVQRHAGARGGELNGDAELASVAASSHRAVLAELDRLRGAGADAAALAAIDTDWSQLAGIDDAEALQASAGALQERIRELAREAAIAGGLGLDDQLAGQLLVDTMTGKLPMLLETMGQARDLGVSAIQRQRLSGSRREALTVVRGVLPSLLGWSRDNLQRLAAADELTASTLLSAFDSVEAAAMGLQEVLTTKVINTSDFDMPPVDYFARGDAAVDAALAFSRRLAPLVDARLAARQQAAQLRFTGVLIGVSVAIVLLAYLLAGVYVAMIGQIRGLEQAARAMAAGDLARRVDAEGRDEIARVAESFNTLAGSLSDLIGEVGVASDEVRRVSATLLEAGQGIAATAGTQRERSVAVAAAVDGLCGEAVQIAGHANATADLVGAALHQAEARRVAAERAGQEMQGTLARIEGSAKAVGELEVRSREVGSIVRVIRDIAEQTNLLALNAAIEAARAGESGRGFAVVADEVRKLADRTRGSTEAITLTIEGIQDDVQRVAEEMRTSGQSVRDSAEVVAGLAGTLTAISGDVRRCLEFVRTIVAATQAQTARSGEITGSMQEMAQIAEANHASVVKTASLAAGLSSLSESLHRRVAALRT